MERPKLWRPNELAVLRYYWHRLPPNTCRPQLLSVNAWCRIDIAATTATVDMSLPWADQPYSLIATEAFSKDTSHAAYYVATQMALAHNGLIRGLNAIYIQAPYIPKDAVKDFLTYCQCWCETMHHHHDGEEDNFFPTIEKITGVKGLMERNVEQHRAFTPGFEAFQKYANSCRVEDFEGAKVRNLVEAFAEPLSQHLHEEIDTLRALDKYDSAKVRQAYKDLEKIEMAGDSVSRIVAGMEPC